MNFERIPPALLEMARQARAKAGEGRRRARAASLRASDVAAVTGDTLYNLRLAHWAAGAADARER